MWGLLTCFLELDNLMPIARVNLKHQFKCVLLCADKLDGLGLQLQSDAATIHVVVYNYCTRAVSANTVR